MSAAIIAAKTAWIFLQGADTPPTSWAVIPANAGIQTSKPGAPLACQAYGAATINSVRLPKAVSHSTQLTR